MDQAPPHAAQYRGARERGVEPGEESAAAPASIVSGAAAASMHGLANGSLGAPFVAFLLLCFAYVIGNVYLAKLGHGLWEDGYFVIRFAHNFWHHATFSWNVADGPVYGMTSQTLQLLGTALYGLAPHHVVLSLKAACSAALFAVLPVGLWLLRSSPPPSSGVPTRVLDRTAGIMPLVIGFSSAPILESTLTGLETVIGLLVVAVSVVCVVSSKGTVRDRALVTASMLAVYVTRPDAVLIPIVLVGGLWLCALYDRTRGGERASRGAATLKALTWVLVGFGAGMGVLLAAFQLYYGTALPLPFYVKTHGLTVQPADYIIYFEPEKTANALQAALFAFPFVFVALHERSRIVLLLLLSGALFSGYHYFATIETMGYMSRFYLPGLVPVFIAGGLAYGSYQLRRSWILSALACALYVAACIELEQFDPAPPTLGKYLPGLAAACVMLLCPAGYNAVGASVIGLYLGIGVNLNYPIEALALEDDETILLRQVGPRPVFRGLERLRVLEPKVIYHTDMGAPGVLFPEAKVVDLDGLLNEDITLRGARFEELCQADRPEAVFVPNRGYAQLRQEVLSSKCIKRYRAVSSTKNAPLRVRKDLVSRYLRED